MEYKPLTDAELEHMAKLAQEKSDITRERVLLELMHLRQRVSKNEVQLDLMRKTISAMLLEPQVEIDPQVVVATPAEDPEQK